MSQSPEANNLSLSPKDAQLLDALVEVGFDVSGLEGLSTSDRRRAEALASVFGLLEDYPVADAEDVLVHATIARVRRARVSRTAKARAGASERRTFRIRIPDFLSMAAIVLIGVSVAWPILGAVRQRAIDSGCVANLRSLGSGFAMYASANDGRIPMATAGFGAGLMAARWVDPGMLAEQGYCDHGHLNCPGHPHGGGYSRQVLRPDAAFSWFAMPEAAFMGDRNPMVDARLNAVFADPSQNSTNHRGRGQNILLGNGSTSWLERPVVDAVDNIWLINGQTRFEPGAAPQSDHDVFLAH